MFDGLHFNPEYNIVGITVERYEEYTRRGLRGQDAMLLHLWIMYRAVGLNQGTKIKIEGDILRRHLGLTKDAAYEGLRVLLSLGVISSFGVVGDEYQINTGLSSKEFPIILEIIDCWNAEDLQKHKAGTVLKRIKRKHQDVIKELGVEVVKKAIRNYATVVNGSEYFFSYRWSLWEFLGRDNGILNFIDEADPLNKYSRNARKAEEPTIEELYG